MNGHTRFGLFFAIVLFFLFGYVQSDLLPQPDEQVVETVEASWDDEPIIQSDQTQRMSNGWQTTSGLIK